MVSIFFFFFLTSILVKVQIKIFLILFFDFSIKILIDFLSKLFFINNDLPFRIGVNQTPFYILSLTNYRLLLYKYYKDHIFTTILLVLPLQSVWFIVGNVGYIIINVSESSYFYLIVKKIPSYDTNLYHILMGLNNFSSNFPYA